MNEISVIAIQARVSSKRLPNKVLQKVEGSTLIEHLIRNLCRTKLPICLLVPQQERVHFSFLDNLVQILSVNCPVNDVLTRYVYCARFTGAQNIIRVTGDNPVTSIDCLLACLQHHRSVCADLTTMVNIPYGSGVEILSKSAIFMLDEFSKEKSQREHVCSFIYENAEKFVICKLPPAKGYQSDIHVSIDIQDDVTLYKKRLIQQDADGKNKFLDLKQLIAETTTSSII